MEPTTHTVTTNTETINKNVSKNNRGNRKNKPITESPKSTNINPNTENTIQETSLYSTNEEVKNHKTTRIPTPTYKIEYSLYIKQRIQPCFEEENAFSSNAFITCGNFIVNFNLNYATSFGEKIFIVGNQEILGNWNPTRAYPMVWATGNN